MFTPGHKRNLTKSRIEELLRKEMRLEQLMLERDLTPFCNDFCEKLGILAEQTPWDQWPYSWKIAFQYSADKFPIPSKLYKDNLPKR